MYKVNSNQSFQINGKYTNVVLEYTIHTVWTYIPSFENFDTTFSYKCVSFPSITGHTS